MMKKRLLLSIALFLLPIFPLMAVFWGSPVNVGAADVSPDVPQVGYANSGKAVAVWQKFNINNKAIEILASNFNGATWSTPVAISGANNDAINPQVAVNKSNGTAIAVWSEIIAGNSFIRYSTFDGTNWAAPTTLSAAGSAPATFPQVAINDSGKAVVVWQGIVGADTRTQAATFDGTTWSAIANISPTTEKAAFPQVGIDSSGKAVAVWQALTSGGINQIEANNFNGTSWVAAPTTISPTPAIGNPATIPQVAVNSSGKAAAVWVRSNGSFTIVQAAQFNGSNWTGVVDDLSINGQNATDPQVAMFDNGNEVAIWVRNNIIQAATYDGVTWTGATDLTSSGSAGTPQVTVDSNKPAVAVWVLNSVIQAATLNGTVWDSPVNISSISLATQTPQVAVNNSGNAVAVWQAPFANLTSGLIQSAFATAIDPNGGARSGGRCSECRCSGKFR